MEEKLYRLVVGEKEAERCEDIEEAANVPRNFGKQVIASVGSKIGDQLSKPGLVLTWLLTMLGAPATAIGMLAPVREAGSLLPQIILGNVIRHYSRRKYFWATGSALQGLSVIAMGCVALTLKGPAAGWPIVGLLVVFSLSRGICSVTSKDLLGRTIPKTQRGRLTGLASSIAGWVALATGLFFVFNPTSQLPVEAFAVLLFVAGFLWLLAAAMMSTLLEAEADTPGGDGISPLREAWQSLRFFREDPVFLRFCIARALLASTVLSMPFIVVLAHGATGGRSASLGLLMIVSSLATASSGVIWGNLADRSSRKTLAVAGLSAGFIGCFISWLVGFDWGETAAFWLFGILFFLIGLAHTGIRIGRKTYLVDHAKSGNRARLVALSNTAMGIVLLLSGAFGLLAATFGERFLILVFGLLGIGGAAMAFTLPEIGDSD